MRKRLKEYPYESRVRPSWKRAAATVVGAFALRAATFALPLFNSDEGYLAIEGHVLARGGRMYLDVADRKPPLVPWIYAAVFRVVGSDSLYAVHVVAALVVAATALVVARIVTNEAQRSGASDEKADHAGHWAAGLYVCASVCFLPADMLAANFEIWMALPLAASLLVLASAGRRALRSLAGGLLLGIALLSKQQAAVAILPAAMLVLARQPSPAKRVRDLLGLVGGVAFPIAVAAHFTGARELWFWTASGNGGYLALDTASLADDLATGLATTLGFLAANLVLTICVGVALLRARRQRRSLDGDWPLVWLAVSASAVCAGLRFFGHYYLQLLAPAIVLGAPIGASTSGRWAARARLAVLVPALGFALLGFFSPRVHGMPDWRPLANYIESHTDSDERILVWGHYPELHWAAGRMPAWRFVHSGFLTGVSSGRDLETSGESAATAGAWSAAMSDLARTRPRLVIDTSTAALRGYEHHPIARYPKLAAWLAASYAKVAVVAGATVYQRIER